MEARALETLKTMLEVAEVEDVPAPMDETRMFVAGGVLLVFSDKSRVTDREFAKLLEYAETNGHTQGMIIVSPSSPPESCVNAIRAYIANRDNPLVQIFEIRHLGFDISTNIAVPAHRVLQKAELDAFYKEFSMKPDTLHLLPKIDCQDAMAKRIRARPGDVVEIGGLARRARLCI
jgi:DNA-directed RNA polymerase subunit H (RpoH/RPB5)